MDKKIEKLTVYYDGTCPMCTAFKNHSENNTEHQEVEFCDVHTTPTPDSLSKEELLSEIKIVDNNGNIINGSDSIFTVLRKHKRLFWLGYLGGLPVIKQCARPIYRLISAQRHFIFGSLSVIFWIRVIVILGLLAGLVISLPLWIGDRIIPLVPVFNTPLPDIISTGLFLILIPTLIWALMSPKPKIALFLAPLILGLLALLDQNRIQPWVYQYGAILLLLSTYSWKSGTQHEQEKILNVLRLMIAGIYFYSGLQKLNPIFITSVFPWMLEPYFGEEYYTFSVFLGFLIPFIEMFIGIGLLFKKTRVLALAGSFAMLVFVLWVLGPFGNNWNMVVWPWNIVFSLLAFILFWRLDKSIFQIFSIPRTVTSFTIVILFIFFPILFFFGKWDGYLSFSLYSGQVADIRVTLPNDINLTDETALYIVEDKYGIKYLNVMWLAVNDIHVPVYPETRVYKVVAKEICALFMNDKRIDIEFIPSLYWVKNQDLSTYSCEDLRRLTD